MKNDTNHTTATAKTAITNYRDSAITSNENETFAEYAISTAMCATFLVGVFTLGGFFFSIVFNLLEVA